jgi:cytochrome bd-type quinol oxidase subunit 2
MKRFFIAYLVGVLMVLVFYIMFPLIIEGEMLDLSSERVLDMMIPQMLFCGVVFGVVFTIIGFIYERNKIKRETEKVMKEYFEYQMRKENENK